ncbi:hypothetical protein LTR66_011951, partial [Elasticomyces elasticus]
MKPNVHITRGDLKRYSYTDSSGQTVNCYYCSNCTTHVYRQVLDPNQPDKANVLDMRNNIIILTTLTDQGNGLKPTFEIFGKSKPNWEPLIAKTYEIVTPVSNQHAPS